MIESGLVSLGILAGGQARRLGGIDKARVVRDGRQQLERVLAALPHPFRERLLSYNRDPSGLPGVGLRVVSDLRPGFVGPVAALEALAAACHSPWLLTVPVDCRELPPNLAIEMFASAGPDGTAVDDADGTQPLVGLWRVAALRRACNDVLATASPRAMHVREALALGRVDLSPHRLGNLNLPEDFAS